ncbi:retrovirus-related pol polyprotein from transposon TNT 1-94 [Tanacetum coccineum]
MVAAAMVGAAVVIWWWWQRLLPRLMVEGWSTTAHGGTVDERGFGYDPVIFWYGEVFGVAKKLAEKLFWWLWWWSPAAGYLGREKRELWESVGIEHQTSTARTPEQNGVVERRNRTLVEAARTMLSAAKVPLFFWAEAIATTCFTQNRSLIIPRHEKTPYHIINGRKPSVKFFHIFGSLCYIVRDGENLDKIKEKDHVSSNPVPQCPTTALEQGSLSPGPQSQENVPQAAETVATSNELDLLFSLMFDELLNGTTTVMSKSSAVTAANALNQCQQQNITPSTSTTVASDTPPLIIQTTPPLIIQTTPKTTNQAPTQAPSVTAIENINQAETKSAHTRLVNLNSYIIPCKQTLTGFVNKANIICNLQITSPALTSDGCDCCGVKMVEVVLAVRRGGCRKYSPEKNGRRKPYERGEEWLDMMKHEFSGDPRNVRLGLAADGFNPFGMMSQNYSQSLHGEVSHEVMVELGRISGIYAVGGEAEGVWNQLTYLEISNLLFLSGKNLCDPFI